ncbi:hypothetical protein O0S10_04105 [Methanocorpusculum sp. MG]|uniref:Uncharacterized protein n=1 Tax=Methanocorpusculum petauri TaxID=3002863 RepID=A0ABT4IGQ5_9EURY|nr:hypothetical protein [Methanocorpusculum petauri]MCZ0860412.1 hypothetical protein [Methanocorpusculum petauri]
MNIRALCILYPCITVAGLLTDVGDSGCSTPCRCGQYQQDT